MHAIVACAAVAKLGSTTFWEAHSNPGAVQYARLVRDAARGSNVLSPDTQLAAGPLVPRNGAGGNWAAAIIEGTLPGNWTGSSVAVVPATLQNATLWSPSTLYTTAQSLLVRAREDAALRLVIDQNVDSGVVDAYRSYYEANSPRVSSADDDPGSDRARTIGAVIGSLAGIVIIGAHLSCAQTTRSTHICLAGVSVLSAHRDGA